MNSMEEIIGKYGLQPITDKFDTREAIVENNRINKRLQMKKDAARIVRQQAKNSSQYTSHPKRVVELTAAQAAKYVVAAREVPESETAASVKEWLDAKRACNSVK